MQVVIYSPARTASQQGMGKTLDKAGKQPPWKLEFSTEQKYVFGGLQFLTSSALLPCLGVCHEIECKAAVRAIFPSAGGRTLS